MSGPPEAAWEDDGHCLVCGRDNPEGLKLEFEVADDRITTSFTAEKRHQGYRDVLHGGVLATVLDEVMVLLPYRRFGVPVATAELTVKLSRPVTVGRRVRVQGAFVDAPVPGRRLYRMRAEATLDDGTVVARAEGKCVPVRGARAGGAR